MEEIAEEGGAETKTAEVREQIKEIAMRRPIMRISEGKNRSYYSVK